jgi:ribonucleoside-diphosphate reductase alpha chain
MLPIDSLQAKLLNKQIFKKIKQECLRASRHLAEINGEPKFCKGLGIANATFTAIAPNTSSALLCGGFSQGIEPIVANVYNQNTAAGEVTRMNPLLLKYLKENNLYSEKLLSDIAINYQGSIQHIRGIPEDVKRVFATAYEIDQYKLIDLAADRQPELCQSQSLNLFFTSESTEQDIAAVTKYAINHENIVSLYYQRGVRSVRGSSGECVACEA